MTGDYEQYPNDWQAASKTETGSTAGRVHDKANTFLMSPRNIFFGFTNHSQERPRTISLPSQHPSRPLSSRNQRPHSSFSLTVYRHDQQHYHPNLQQKPHSNSLSSDERVWDGENTLRFAPNRMDAYPYSSNQQMP
jgi:hypothetical protein